MKDHITTIGLLLVMVAIVTLTHHFNKRIDRLEKHNETHEHHPPLK